jgi:hypothetical protein
MFAKKRNKKRKNEPIFENVARGYIRTDSYHEVEIQSTQIQEYCIANGFELIKIYNLFGIDNIVHFDELLKDIRKGEEIIILDLFVLTSLEFASIMDEAREWAHVIILSHLDYNANNDNVKLTLSCILAMEILKRQMGMLPDDCSVSGAIDINSPIGELMTTIVSAVKKLEDSSEK